MQRDDDDDGQHRYEDNSIENDTPLDAAAEDSNSNRSKNDPGKNYCAAFTWIQTVQVAEHLFATAQVFWLALTNLLRVLGCRPSSLHTMHFDRTMQSSFDPLAKHLWRVRTEYSKNHNVPQCFAVAMDMTNPILPAARRCHRIRARAYQTLLDNRQVVARHAPRRHRRRQVTITSTCRCTPTASSWSHTSSTRFTETSCTPKRAPGGSSSNGRRRCTLRGARRRLHGCLPSTCRRTTSA